MELGIFLLVLTAAVCHAGWNFIARKVSGNLAVLWLALFAGCIFLFPGTLAVLFTSGFYNSISSQTIPYVIASGIVHGIYFLLLSLAYEHGEISVVYPIARGSGIGFTAFLGWFFLKESISFWGGVGIFLVFAGILSIGIPEIRKGGHTKTAVRIALCVGCTIIAFSLVDKVGVQNANPIVYIWIMFIITTLVMAPFVIKRYIGNLNKIWIEYNSYIWLIGVGCIVTYSMILFAFRKEAVSYIIATREFAVVFGSMMGVVFLKEKLTFVKAAAIVAITCGLICIKIG